MILDDGSTDNTRAVVEALTAKDNRIRYVCMLQNGGALAARNEGVKQVREELEGEIFPWLLCRNSIGAPTMLMKKECFLEAGGISSGAGAYYESRCRMIARYKTQMTEYGIFDLVVSDLFERAEKNGMLENVKKMLMLQLAQ